MAKSNTHVVPRPNGQWGVKKEGGQRASGVYNTQKEAKNAAVTNANKSNSTVYVHSRDGRISGTVSPKKDK